MQLWMPSGTPGGSVPPRPWCRFPRESPKQHPRAGHRCNTLGRRRRRVRSCPGRTGHATPRLAGVQTPAPSSTRAEHPHPLAFSTGQHQARGFRATRGAQRGAGDGERVQITARSEQRLQTLAAAAGAYVQGCQSGSLAALGAGAGVFARGASCKPRPHLCQQHVAVPGHWHNTPRLRSPSPPRVAKPVGASHQPRGGDRPLLPTPP